MAGTIPLSEAKRRVENALDGYAQGKGWKRDDYVLVVHASRWDSLHILLAAKEYDDAEGFAARDKEVLDHLETSLGHDVLKKVGLLRTMSLAKYREMALGDHARELMDRLGMTDEDLYKVLSC